jgi:hypothetical protein
LFSTIGEPAEGKPPALEENKERDAVTPGGTGGLLCFRLHEADMPSITAMVASFTGQACSFVEIPPPDTTGMRIVPAGLTLADAANGSSGVGVGHPSPAPTHDTTTCALLARIEPYVFSPPMAMRLSDAISALQGPATGGGVAVHPSSTADVTTLPADRFSAIAAFLNEEPPQMHSEAPPATSGADFKAASMVSRALERAISFGDNPNDVLAACCYLTSIKSGRATALTMYRCVPLMWLALRGAKLGERMYTALGEPAFAENYTVVLMHVTGALTVAEAVREDSEFAPQARAEPASCGSTSSPASTPVSRCSSDKDA